MLGGIGGRYGDAGLRWERMGEGTCAEDRRNLRRRDRRLRGQRHRLRGHGGEGFLGQGDPRESFRSGTEPIEYRPDTGSLKAGWAGLREGLNWEALLK